ncbi:hypothetical protein E4198_21920 [Streptomyces sp. RKND-216]|uniref:protein kinase domain-containing protein n=1 Tax=Streptomyces sp. RKND-216 TaxID=2562581 RepID=UPI00109E1944|nr:protein kinase [Streptomyces sp. RKND-216]THA26964.1 hypothetical protein E4198_21920 [Streptomyces sp. RKND-216]
MQQIGTYVLERELGRGALGTVHLARTAAGRAVAVKVLHSGAARDEAADDRLRAAVGAARGVGGFHTAPVLDADTDADTPWFATPYVPGPSLAELLASGGALGEDEVRRLGTGVADALRSVHARGLAHGGLKASDVLMADDGPCVRDFGLRPAPGGDDAAAAADDVRALGGLLLAACGGDTSRVPAALGAAVQACLDDEPARRPAPEALIAALAPETQTQAGEPAPVAPVAARRPAGAPPVPAQAPAPPPMPPVAPAPGPGWYAPPPAQAGRPEHPAQMPPPGPGGFGPAAPMAPPGQPGHPAQPRPGAPGMPGGEAGEPEFLAMDRKNDIVADAHGVSFTAHGRSTHLAWQHIRFAQHRRDPQGSSHVLTLVLHLTNGAQTVSRVSTRNTWELEQWAAQLDVVLSRFLPRR